MVRNNGHRSSVFGLRGVEPPPDGEPRSQHFLHSRVLVARLVQEMQLAPGSLLLDVGAGSGIISRALADAGCRVVAIERDARLYRRVASRFADDARVECVHADALTHPLPDGAYGVVSNVPFSITSALIRRLLDASRPPDDAWLIVQREAAMKFAGVPRETMFSLLRKPQFSIEIAKTLARTDFVPAPPVDVAMLHVQRRPQPLVAQGSMGMWQRLVRRGYRSGAPDMRTAMRPYFTRRQLVILSRDLRFDLRAPPSSLTFGQWLAMFRFHAQACRGPSVVGSGKRDAGCGIASCTFERARGSWRDFPRPAEITMPRCL